MIFGASEIWSLTTDPQYGSCQHDTPPAYLTREQQIRFLRIRQARMLYEGRHFEYFVLQGRTQWAFPRLRATDGNIRTIFVQNNLMRRICDTSVELLFGKEPLISVEDAIQEQKLKDLAKATNLNAVLMEMEAECSFAGEASVEVCIHQGAVYLQLVPGEEIHPVGIMLPDRQYSAYVRYATQNIGTDTAPVILMLETYYRVGTIERHCYQMDGDAKGQEVGLENWPAYAATQPPLPIEKTGITYNTIVWFPNLFMGRRALSDLDGLHPQQDTLNAKETQVSGVLAKHANPKIRAPRSAADNKGNARASAEVLYSDKPDDWGYITFDASLSDARAERDHMEDAMCTTSGTSPVLVGLVRGGAPESAKALKLRAYSSVKKAEKKAALRRPVIERLLLIAQLLDQTIPGNGYTIGPITVEPRDGLPVDDTELAQYIVNARSAGAMSVDRAVALQIDDPIAAKAEVALIKAEKAADAPSISFGEPGESTNDPQPGDAPDNAPAHTSEVAA